MLLGPRVDQKTIVGVARVGRLPSVFATVYNAVGILNLSFVRGLVGLVPSSPKVTPNASMLVVSCELECVRRDMKPKADRKVFWYLKINLDDILKPFA